jgi:hypothetical protein
MTTGGQQAAQAASQKRVLTSRLAAGSADPNPPQPAKGEVAGWIEPGSQSQAGALIHDEVENYAAVAMPSVSSGWAAVHSLEPAARPNAETVNAPVTWPQLAGAIMTDLVTFLIAGLPGLITYLSGVGPTTPRAIVAVALTLILTGLLAVQHATGTTGLMLRLKARGQLAK